MGGLLSGGFAALNRPAKSGFFLTEKLGVWRAAFQQPLRLRGEGLWWGVALPGDPTLRGGGLNSGEFCFWEWGRCVIFAVWTDVNLSRER